LNQVLVEESRPVSKTISVVVIGRSLNQQERMRLRSASQTPLAIVAELPTAPQALERIESAAPASRAGAAERRAGALFSIGRTHPAGFA
jgi:hypothetical protein